MDVALVYPEVYDMARFREGRKEFPPFGVLYLAAALREAGHGVRIDKVAPDSPPLDLTSVDAVGFSLASSATYGVLLEARRAALLHPGALVLAGGVHANFYPEETLRDFEADVVAVGGGEQLVVDILDRAADRDFDGLPGVVRRGPDGSVRSAPARPVARDISDLPLPARDLLPADDLVMTDRLAGRPLRMAHVMLSRGCPFPCTFCAAGQTRIQYRDGARTPPRPRDHRPPGASRRTLRWRSAVRSGRTAATGAPTSSNVVCSAASMAPRSTVPGRTLPGRPCGSRCARTGAHCGWPGIGAAVVVDDAGS